MRWLLWTVLIVAAVWSGLWFAGAHTVERTVTEGLAEAAPALTVEAHSLAGFPNRFDLTLTGLRLSDAGAGLSWQAPFVQILALSYRPWHTILALPPEQRLDWPGGGLTVLAGKLQASLVLRPVAALPLDRLTVVGEGLEFRPDTGPALRLATLHFATRPDATAANAHEIGLAAAAIAPDADALARLPPDTRLPPVAERLAFDLIARFSAPLDRFAAQSRPVVTALEVRSLSLVWGDIVLAGEGTLTPDADGRAEGRIALRLDQWRKAIDAAVALGALRPEIAPTWAEFARRMAEAGGTPDRLELPLIFTNGRMSLGPIPLGPAPRLAP